MQIIVGGLLGQHLVTGGLGAGPPPGYATSIIIDGFASRWLVTRGLGSGGYVPPTSLREAIQAWLGTLPGLVPIVGTRIYFAIPSQLSAYPCIVVKVASRSYGHNLAGADATSDATVELTALALFESQSVAAAEVIRSNFDAFRGTQSGLPIMANFLTDELDDEIPPPDGSDNWICLVTLEYQVRHRVSQPALVQFGWA
jgi:hypothetical protein